MIFDIYKDWDSSFHEQVEFITIEELYNYIHLHKNTDILLSYEEDSITFLGV